MARGRERREGWREGERRSRERERDRRDAGEYLIEPDHL